MKPIFSRLFAASARKEGNAARDRQDWAAAASAFRRYLDLDPEAAAIHVQLGHMLKEEGDLTAAACAYETARSLAPHDAEILVWIGDIHRREGRLVEACEAFAASHALDGNTRAQRDLVETRELMLPPVPEPEPTPESEFEPALLSETDQAPEPVAPPPHETAPEQAGVSPPAEPPVEPSRASAERQIGHVDAVRGHVVSGWAMEPDRAGSPVDVDFDAGGTLVGTATADLVRHDVAALGGHGFRTELDLNGFEGEVWVSARLRHTGEELRSSPFRIDRHVPAPPPLACAAHFEVMKPLAFAPGGELCLFVTHSKTGAVKPHVLPHVRALAAEGIATLLIVVADRPADIDTPLLDALAGAIVRENRGYDFACWAHALRLYPQAYAASLLYLTNDSIFGPVDQARFAAMIARMRASPADLVGLTESHEHRWHAQSYFLGLKPALLGTVQLQRFFASIRMQPGKDDVIQSSEIALAPLAETIGLKVEVLFPSPAVRNPTLFGWRELLDRGYPYVKMLLLRGEFPMADIDGWQDVLADHGFDMPLLHATLATGTEGWSPVTGYPLLARPRRRDASKDRLKIAFFGPWNYDNGLGSASRGLIAAIRRCDVRLNLYPIEKPFHVHKQLAPPVSVTDFVGPADIAVVHLNPDSWHLLTDDQRAMIGAAGKRIGHWVWEMAHIPPAWRHNFSSVDRIWAPSGYCASLFEGEGEAPVDVVPYTVPLPRTKLCEKERARLRTVFGVPVDHRIILYAFDGSSYLIRKNPMALVRAFAASHLAKNGWTLILKTKHLFDRPEEGRALDRLARGTPGVVLLNASMSAGEMANLAALCDIYASTHCSEGFGLTIAEAMAAGKPVVATDFGGSTQFLDSSCGYPVPAFPWALEEDFGHYTKGGEWARIDEKALAATLRRAAKAVDTGKGRIGEKARQRIADTLSYDAIGRLIGASFESVVTDDRPIARATPRIESDLAVGMRFETVTLGDMLRAIPIAADLAPPGRRTAVMANLPTDRDHWLVFAPGDACISPLFRRIVTDLCEARMDADLIYTDDLALGEARLGDQLRMKPAFDVTMLAAQDYIGVPLIVRASAFQRLGGFDDRAGAAALNDLLFRAHALGMAIVPLPQTLLAWKGRRPVVPRSARRAMLARLPTFAAHDILDGLTPESLQLRRRFGADDAPAVTIVIPTRRSARRGGGVYIERLLARLAETDWPMERLAVLIGDDIPGRPGWQHDDWPFALERIETPRAKGEAFNYAAKMNRLWRAAGTEHIVLMNDDVTPTDTGWLRALMTFAADESVGGVGARLLYEDGRLQHAGMVPMFDFVAHPWAAHRADARGYQDWPLVQREWSMVTGAVFATRRAMMEQINGFEERFSLEYNDVDLCLRMRALGYRIVYTPHAELVHAEKASRGQALPPGQDLALFLERWHGWLQHDPSYHPHLTRDRMNIEPIADPNAWYR